MRFGALRYQKLSCLPLCVVLQRHQRCRFRSGLPIIVFHSFRRLVFSIHNRMDRGCIPSEHRTPWWTMRHSTTAQLPVQGDPRIQCGLEVSSLVKSASCCSTPKDRRRLTSVAANIRRKSGWSTTIKRTVGFPPVSQQYNSRNREGGLSLNYVTVTFQSGLGRGASG